VIFDAVVGVGGNIVMELVNSSAFGFSSISLLGADGTECYEKLVINGVAVP